MCPTCLPALIAAPTPSRRSARSNLTDISVSSSTDSSRNNTEPHMSSEDVAVGSQSVVAPPSFEQPGSEPAESQPFLSQESRNPNTQRVLQENRRKPGPKSAKRQRDIETAKETTNWRERFNKRVRTGGSSSNTSGAMSRSRSPHHVTSPINTSPQPDRSFIVRTSSSTTSGQNVTNNTMAPPPPQRPASQPTDDANGHSNLAAPRRITVQYVPPPNPGPVGTFNARNSGKLPGG